MSNSYMKSAYFQTQVNQANRIKECYPCGTGCSQIVNYYLPTDLTLSSLTVTGKATILGLIDPTGLEFTPVTTNPGGVQANTIWVNSTDANKLYFGASPVTGGGGGGVNSVTAGTNISTSGTATDPIINFAPGGAMNMNGAQLTSVSTVSVSSISDVSLIDSLGNDITINTDNIFVNTSSISYNITDFYNVSANGGSIIIGSTGDMDLSSGNIININPNIYTKFMSGIINKTLYINTSPYLIIPSDYTIITGTPGTIINLPLVDSDNVGKIHIVLYSGTSGTCTVSTSLSQNIYRKTGSVTSSSISLLPGYSYMFQAVPLDSGSSVFGWLAI
jgi:hypothetical protein